jgi:hypothetical protein
MKLKVGDLVLTTRNFVWGKIPMEITKFHNGAIMVQCKHKELGIGAFDIKDLVKAKDLKSRNAKLKALNDIKREYYKLEDKINELENKKGALKNKMNKLTDKRDKIESKLFGDSNGNRY